MLIHFPGYCALWLLGFIAGMLNINRLEEWFYLKLCEQDQRMQSKQKNKI